MRKRRVVLLGSLTKNRVFYYGSRRFKVAANLGPAGVSIRSLAATEVKIGARTFKSVNRATEVWSAGSPVEVNYNEESGEDSVETAGEVSDDGQTQEGTQ